MKIYKNPDGPDMDVLYPTLFFTSIGFIVYYLIRTCITTDEFWGISLISLVGSYGAYYYLKNKSNKNIYANLFIASTATPALVALFLATNALISFEMFHAKSEINGHIQIEDRNIYVRHDNAPILCPRVYKLTSASAIYNYNYVETKINRGIFGFPVLKYHKLSVD
jgi:hypothetical protein